MRSADASMVGGGMADLRRLRGTRERDGGVDLRGGRADSSGRPADATPSRARRGSARGWLGSHAVGRGALGVGLLLLLLGRRRVLLGRLLRRLLLLELLGLRLRRRRRNREARRSLGHLMLGTELLVLGRGRRGRGQATLASAGHDAVEEAVARRNRWRLLRRACVRRRSAVHSGGCVAAARNFELAAKMLDLVFIPRIGAYRQQGTAWTTPGWGRLDG